MDQDLKKDEQTLEENVQSVENKNVAEAKKSEDEAVATVNFNAMERGELLEAAKELLKNPSALAIKESIESIKQTFYRKLKAENSAEKEVAETVPDALETEFKAVLAQYKEKKAAENKILEEEKWKNYELKKQVLDELEKLTESSDDLSETVNAFRKLQQEWKQIGQVPQEKVTPLWKLYNQYQERFYDLIKINNELRDYDFKKNLELKTNLCEVAERLASEEDVLIAFKTLQGLHEEWREIGPVARDLREEIWQRFKDASKVINKKHQALFQLSKEEEEALIKEKEAICDKIEAMDLTQKSHKKWENNTKVIIELQNKWKEIGAASNKNERKLYKRFRSACDAFFKAKSEFFKTIKKEFAANLEKKKELCEIAESLKDSTDWKETTEKFVALQKEWKTIGATSKKQSDAVWQRFVTACDYFFDQKDKNFSGKKTEEIENFNRKREIIAKIEAFERTGDDAADLAALKALSAEYNAIGHVPFKKKDALFKAFKKATDLQFEAFQKIKNDVKKASAERNKLMKEYTTLRNEIATYENNIGFFAASKKAKNMVEEMNKKIDALKEKLADIEKKIQEIDNSID
ncbi:MAG: DUF349 domain-containing protein [Paludibacteraceae bacterium]